MILIKDNVKRTLNDKETIKIFLDAGWKEFIPEQPKPKKEK